jgi:small ligand-binding sensory domain FIST
VSPVRFASAVSGHPVTSLATGEVIGSVLETIGERPDLVVVTVTRAHAGALEDVVSTIDALLHPLALIGCAAESVVGRGTEVEEVPGVSLWAGQVGPLVAFSLSAVRRADDEWAFAGWPDHVGFEPSAALILADPFTFPAHHFCTQLRVGRPGLAVIGGYTRLALGERIRDNGAVAVLLGSATEIVPVLSQGCRPFGKVMTVTRVEHNLVLEIAGRPAMDHMVDQIGNHLGRSEITGIESNGILLGRCVDVSVLDPRRADLLFRPLVGVERATGALVQFALRTAGTASDDLAEALSGRSADAALLFPCSGRGSRLFDVPDHDAGAVARSLGPIPLGGCFASGEFGPVGGENFVHNFAASMALFRERGVGGASSHAAVHDR